MIEKTSLNPLRHLDFFQIMSLIRTYLDAEDLANLKLTEAATAFGGKLANLDAALKQGNSIAATKDLLLADEARDKTVMAVYAALRTFTHSPDDTEAHDAEILLQEALKYGKNLAKLPLREESAAITNLLQDFGKPENAARISALRLEGWISKLAQQNSAFDDLYQNCSGDQSEVEVGAVRTARVELQDAFDHLAKTVNAYAFLSGEAPYKPLSDKVNTEVGRALAEAKARSTKAKKDGKQD